MRPQSPDAASPLRVAYLTSAYPYPSHIFIEREVAGLRALGADVRTFTVRPVREDLMLSESMRAERRATRALLDSPRRVLAIAARTARRSPAGVFRGLKAALGSGEATVRSRTWQTFYLAEAIRLRELMLEADLRHVHVHLANNGADIARLLVTLGEALDGPDAGWRWTLSMHGPTEFEAAERFDLAAKVRSAAGVACISDFTRSQLMRYVEPEHWPKLTVVRMSVDLDKYPPRATWAARGDRLRLLSVGRLVPEKGAPVLLEAVAVLRDRGVAVEAHLVGAGELKPLLENRIAELGLEELVCLVGAVGQDELPSHYAWADVFCLPSFQEGLPVVLMEAMSAAIPVVTTPIAGIPELVEPGLTGLLVAPGRADLFADAVTRLAESELLRGELGRAGRERVAAEYATAVTSRNQFAFLERHHGGAR